MYRRKILYFYLKYLMMKINKKDIIVYIIFIFSIALLLYSLYIKFIKYYIHQQNSLYLYESPEGVIVASPYTISQLQNITVYPYNNIFNLSKQYRTVVLFFNPNLSGNYTLSIVNIIYRIPTTYPVCYPSNMNCIYNFVGNIGNYMIIQYMNTTNVTLIPYNTSLILYLSPANNNTIYIENNRIYLYGDSNDIEKVAYKFILSYYGIINN